MARSDPSANELSVNASLETASVSVRNVVCHGGCAHRSPEECAASTYLVFPYRGLYVRHVGSDQAVADANHVVFFNADEGYRIAHPVEGSDASLSVQVAAPLLEELAPASLLDQRPPRASARITGASTPARRRWWPCSATGWSRGRWNRWKRKPCC